MIRLHDIDMCPCDACTAQRAYEAEQAARARGLDEALRALGDAVLTPARWLLDRLIRLGAR
jgi:hypothetical protein